MRTRRQQRGFTLIEVLLALALTALLLSLLSGGMYLVSRDWNNSADDLDSQLDDALIILQIERALLASFPHSVNNNETLLREIYFLGEDDRVSWVSVVSPQRQPGLTAWALESSADGVTLRLAPAFADSPDARLEESEARLILPDYDLELSYLRETNEFTREWLDEWEGSEIAALPLAVHALFRARDDTVQQDYEVVAPIKAWRHRSIMPNTLSQRLGQ